MVKRVKCEQCEDNLTGGKRDGRGSAAMKIQTSHLAWAIGTFACT